MSANHMKLSELKGKILAPDKLFALPEWGDLFSRSQELDAPITVYVNRQGMVKEVIVGDEPPPERILERRYANRLSGVRALRLLPKTRVFPRGRDRLLLSRYRLDLMLAVFHGPRAALLLPGISQGRLVAGLERIEPVPVQGITDLESLKRLTAMDKALSQNADATVGAEVPRAILVTLDVPSRNQGIDGAEMARLCQTAGFNPVITVQQKIDHPNPLYFLGSGKVREIGDLIMDHAIDGVVLSTDVSYPQKRRLKKNWNVPVMDRTDIILHIFSRHASSQEGRLQVQIATLYQHLQQMIKEQRFLERQGAGIGTRGPGETAQEMARRRIYKRKNELENKLAKLSLQRRLQRKRRQHLHMPHIALVGYTNASKSTLLQALSHADIVTADQLFTTLETRTRRCRLAPGKEILASDTVGFIKHLPHHFVHAFHSTLEAALDGSLICMVVDGSDDRMESRLETVLHTLKQLDAGAKQKVLILNKMDQVSAARQQELRLAYPEALPVSALTGWNLQALKQKLLQLFFTGYRAVSLRVPFAQGAVVSQLHEQGCVNAVRYDAQGVLLEAALSPALLRQYRSYIID